MQYNTELAEMANTADYAAMNYGELLKTKLAFNMAVGLQINPLLEEKRLDEMAKITHIYITTMNAYDATRLEILTCLEAEGMKETRVFTHTQNVDDQTATMGPEGVRGDETPRDYSCLLLPAPKESCLTDETSGDDTITSSPDGDMFEPVNVHEEDIPAAAEKTLVEKAIDDAKSRPVTDNIDLTKPHFVEHTYTFKDNGELKHRRTRYRNLSKTDLETLRSVSEEYVKVFFKADVVASTEECLVYKEEQSITVKLYVFPKEDLDKAEEKESITCSENCLSAWDLKEMRKQNNYLKKAIKQAKEYSFDDEAKTGVTFYDKYIFNDHGCGIINISGDRVRVYENADNLANIKTIFEVHSRLNSEHNLVLAKDNCVAAKNGDHIYVLVCNLPTHEKKRRVSRKSAPVDQDACAMKESEVVTGASPVQGVSDLILKAVDMTKTLPEGEDVTINAPYSVQRDYLIMADGLLPLRRPFFTKMDGDALEKNKAFHKKYARIMKASHIVSTNDYTAFIWDEGKTITVYYYFTNAANVCNS